MVRKFSTQMRRFPSFAAGTYRQFLATLKPRTPFKRTGTKDAVVLVPGAFSNSAVMNRLGGAFADRGYAVFTPPDFAYFVGFAGNLGPLERSARELMHFLLSLRRQGFAEKVWVVAHSNGAVLSLLALDLAATEGRPELTAMVKGVVSLAAPLRGRASGFLSVRLMPMVRDVLPDSPIIARIARRFDKLKLCVQAERDFLVPPDSQSPEGVRPVTMPGYQHMDFIVGTDERIEATARLVDDHLSRR